MLRAFREDDLSEVMQIWFHANLEAHPFVPEAYWRAHFDEVAALIPRAEVTVYEEAGSLQGFIGVSGTYIAGLFVCRQARGQGVGKRLLDAVKAEKSSLTLHVYEKNERAVRFYRREGFTVRTAEREESTGEPEFCMEWARPTAK